MHTSNASFSLPPQKVSAFRLNPVERAHQPYRGGRAPPPFAPPPWPATLTAAGAEVAAAKPDGGTALALAVSRGALEATRTLLEARADPARTPLRDGWRGALPPLLAVLGETRQAFDAVARGNGSHQQCHVAASRICNPLKYNMSKNPSFLLKVPSSGLRAAQRPSRRGCSGVTIN